MTRAKNLMKTYTDIVNGDVVDFDGYAAADAKNDVDLLITFTDGSDGSLAIPSFLLGQRDERPRGLRNSSRATARTTTVGLNTWILRNLPGQRQDSRLPAALATTMGQGRPRSHRLTGDSQGSPVFFAVLASTSRSRPCPPKPCGSTGFQPKWNCIIRASSPDKAKLSPIASG